MTETTLGPAGGMGGQEFTNYVVPAGAKIKEIHIFAAEYIDALQLVYVDNQGQRVQMPKIGGLGGHRYVFILDDDEYLTGVSGSYGWYLDSFQLHTNKRQSEMYGGSSGEHEFALHVPKGHAVVGFTGRAEWYIDAIGLISRKRAAAPKPATQPKGQPKAKELQKVAGIGPKIAGLLVEQGIYNLQDLAQARVKKLQEILESAGARYRLADPSSWPKQAAQLVKKG